MAELSDKVKQSFDEARLMLLVIQVFLGFQFRVPFEPLFDKLPASSRNLEMASLVLLLAAFVALVAPATLSELSYPGENSTAVQSFATGMIGFSLLAFAGAVSGVIFVVVRTVERVSIAGTTAGVFLVTALWAWYGLALQRRAGGPPRRTVTHGASIAAQTDHMLTEARMIVPGAAALVGFQFATVLMDAFGRLPIGLKRLHLAGTGLVALTIILLIAPAAYHRIAERGEESERVVQFGRRAILASLVPLAAGIAVDTFVVMRAAGMSEKWSLAVPGATVIVAAALWFVYPFVRRQQRAR
jgi:hypothetical protein